MPMRTSPPEIIKAELFSSMPAEFRREGVATVWASARRGGRPIPCFLEGPSFDRAGNLYVTDIPFGRVFRIAPNGGWTLVAEFDGEPNGLKIHKDGRIFITDFKNGLVVLDPETGRTEPVLGRRYTERFKGVNDLFFASNGDLYFTDQGRTGWNDPTGRVYRWTVDGRLTCLFTNGINPNGLVLNLDETQLYVGMTNANAVWHLSLMPHDDVISVGTFIQLSGGHGPDGLALTEDGGLAICHAGMGAVLIHDRKGELICRVDSCGTDFLTNLAFGGEDRRTLYITDAGAGIVQRARLPVAGRAMYSHQT